MKGKGKVGYVTGVIPMPPSTATNYSTWDAKNSIVMAWFINSIEPKIGQTYLFYKTAKEIWDAVREIYSDLKNTAQYFEICSTLHTTRQGNMSITEYYNILIELW